MHKKMPATQWLAWVHVFNYFTCLLDRGASVYWCQKNDNPRFKGISKNQSYYINKQGELVICFDQFEVAPGYMGNPTFTIKNDLLDDYFKQSSFIL